MKAVLIYTEISNNLIISQNAWEFNDVHSAQKEMDMAFDMAFEKKRPKSHGRGSVASWMERDGVMYDWSVIIL